MNAAAPSGKPCHTRWDAACVAGLWLLGKFQGAVDGEFSTYGGGVGFGLAAADGDGVLAGGDDWIAVFCDHVQVSWVQFKLNGLTCAGLNVNPLEAAQGADWRAFHVGEAQVKLRDFVAG